jgi:glycosyltransferase involved in cell wall biosynthesis
MASPRISIVTPSFNQAGFIEETIKSVIDQNYDNLEYIVIDGGSTDGAVQIIERYLPHIHYFISEKDSGHGNALNKGFRASTGEIMGWINSDDKYLPWTLRTVADIFEQHPDVNWIMGMNAFWNDKGAMIDARDVYKNIFDFLAGDFAWVQQESVFWRRSLWNKAGGFINEDYRFMVDGELWTRFFLFDNLWHAKCILSGYRMHRDNRAKEFYAECLAEMGKAIEIMRQKVSQTSMTSIRQDYALLTYDREGGRWRVTSKHREERRKRSYFVRALRKLRSIVSANSVRL